MWFFYERVPEYLGGTNYSFSQLIYIAAFILAAVPAFFIFRSLSLKGKWRFLYVLVGINILIKLFNLLFVGFANPQYFALLTSSGGERNIAKWLSKTIPTTVCAVNTFIFPIALKTKRTPLLQYMVTISLPGAMLGYLGSFGFIHSPYHLFESYTTHFIYITVPLLMLSFRMFKPSFRVAPAVFKTWLGVLTLAFFISGAVNLSLNPEFTFAFPSLIVENGFSADGPFIFDIMWTMQPRDVSLFQWIFRAVPYPYLYLYFVTPIMLAAWAVIILPFSSKKEIKTALRKLLPRRGVEKFPGADTTADAH